METIGTKVIFFGLTTMAIVSASAVVTGRNLFHAAMYLGFFLLAISGYYFLLAADLVAMMQVFVYVGGVIVVLLFGIMLTSRITNVRLVSAMDQKGFTGIAIIALVGLLVSVLLKTTFPLSSEAAATNTTELIGALYLTDYILPFEVISILLLAALIGAVIIARHEQKQ